MLRVLQKNGFVVIENFFPKELMDRVYDALTTWDETEKWNNFTYSDFYSTNPDQLNTYKNRLEIVLPFVDPFETVLSTVHDSNLIDLMSTYANEKSNFNEPINLFMATSIMSRYGASEQTIHHDYGYEASMIKINVAVHDIPQESGPTSFCPW